MVQTIRRLVGLILISAAVMLGLNVGLADAATEPGAATTSRSAQTLDGPFIPIQCRAINLGANVSNFGIGYVFSGTCSPSHPVVVQVQWFDAVNNILGGASGPFPPRTPGTWSTYSGNFQRAPSPQQTSYACVWVTQDVIGWLGGPLLTSGCFPRNS